ncbi:MAG: hypothetical protein IPG35_16925 [Flavobacteriales bacterium]|nr:hypothetical protein [Flavobacteriales bacterium]MBK9701585.1 hypothetical protein [Flavobacteriales bacterium]
MGLVLIGDVGGSSSRWAVSGAGSPRLLHDDGPWPGYNAASGDPTALMHRLRAAATGLGAVEKVMVHAAGCGTGERAKRFADELAVLFPDSVIHVEGDLLGAARAMWGTGPGRILIVGTGMNAAHYDGERLATGIPSLGYILGDEGSGADIGKALLRDAFRGRMPSRVRSVVFGDHLALADVIEAVYRRPGAAATIAAPVKRLLAVRDEPYVQQLLADRFGALAAEVVRVLGPWELRAVGSVAAGFQQELSVALAAQGLSLTRTLADPLPGLITYVQAAELR